MEGFLNSLGETHQTECLGKTFKRLYRDILGLKRLPRSTQTPQFFREHLSPKVDPTWLKSTIDQEGSRVVRPSFSLGWPVLCLGFARGVPGETKQSFGEPRTKVHGPLIRPDKIPPSLVENIIPVAFHYAR